MTDTPQRAPLQALFRRQILALVGLGLLAALQFTLIIGMLRWTDTDTSVVDIAGRQRMLSQQAALHAGTLALATGPTRDLSAEALRDATDDMLAQHETLVNGNPELGVAAPGTVELRDHYFGSGVALDRRVREFVRHGHAIAEGEIGEDGILAFQQEASLILPHLETAVRMQRDSISRQHAWIWIAIGGLFASSLTAIGGLWMFVFRPGQRLLLSDHRRLASAEADRAKDMARQRFQRRVTGALEMVESEGDLMRVFTRATFDLAEEAPMEVLLADSSQAHMRVGATHPVQGGPGCGVESPWQCPALRKGRTSIFPDNSALDSCRYLQDREGSCAAACVPLTFMGDSMGVAHVTFDPDEGVPEEYVNRLEYLASASASRLSTLRSFEQIQLQATTDPLTGLLNRRALEKRVRSLVQKEIPLAVGIADLDHFKRLNDTYGHDAGDRALVTFSKAVREAVRPDDLVARFGGEEFIIVFAESNAEDAANALERVRKHLARVVSGSDTPTFTASFGVSDDRVGTDLAMLIQVADAALLRAKESGRDRVIVADMGDAGAKVEPHPIGKVA